MKSAVRDIRFVKEKTYNCSHVGIAMKSLVPIRRKTFERVKK